MQRRACGCGLRLLATLLFSCTGWAGQANAGSPEQQTLQEQVDQLRRDIAILRQKTTPTREPNIVPPENPGERAALSRVPQNFNPDISAIGDVLFHSGRNYDGRSENQFEFRELELALGAAVDPYGRADFFVGIEGGEAEIEEGYFTFDTLPYDLKARAGKFYSAFGKANVFHTHAMPWVDRPVAIRNYFGEEGMSEPGAELSWLVPNPWEQYFELICDVQNSGNDLSFADGDSRHPMYVGHLKNFFDLNNASTLELGGSVATGENAATGGGHQTTLEGVDVTYKWRPAQQGLYQSLTWMNELLLSQKEQGAAGTVDSHGLYSSLEYQFSRRWSAFGRYDYSQLPDDEDSHVNAGSAGLTFAQSEFAFWRVQFTHAEGDGALAPSSRNELSLQLNFGIGPHRAHQY